MTIERQRARAMLNLKATRERIAAIDQKVAQLQSQGPTEQEAVAAVESWVDEQRAATSFDTFAAALHETGEVDLTKLPESPWIIAAMVDPGAVKRRLVETIRSSGRFEAINREGGIEALRAERTQLETA